MSELRSVLKTVAALGCLLTCLADCGGEHATKTTVMPTSTVTPLPTSTATPANVCVQAGERCLAEVPCCQGLDCCSGSPVPPGEEFCASVCPISDRQEKTGIEPVNPSDVLARLASLPISTWSYVQDPNHVRHMGPMAQDFRVSFGLGAGDRCIPTVDASGVALASIQALNERVEAVRQANQKLKAENTKLRARLDRLEEHLRRSAPKTERQRAERLR